MKDQKEKSREIARLNGIKNASYAEMSTQKLTEYYRKFIKGEGKDGNKGNPRDHQHDESSQEH